MKFVISTQELNYLLSKVLNVVAQKATIPILSNIMIEASKGEITITATDLTVGVRCFTEAKIIEEGATTLPAKRFAQLIRELTAINVEITTNSSEITEIVADSSKFKMLGMSKTEYPALPDMNEAQQIKLEQNQLKEMFYKTSFAVSREDNRYVLTGVFLHVDGQKATFVGTDGKRLARTHLTINTDAPLSGNYIIPLKAVEEIHKCLDSEDEEATLYLMHDKIAIQSSDTLIITKLLTGDYPDVNRVIPEKTETVVTLHREELMTLLRQVSIFTGENKTNSVRFTFSEGELKLSANTMEIGEGLVRMPVDYSGSKMEIAFNPDFVGNILKHSKAETVKMGLTDSFNPAVITDQESFSTVTKDSSPLYLIMPMRLEESSMS